MSLVQSLRDVKSSFEREWRRAVNAESSSPRKAALEQTFVELNELQDTADEIEKQYFSELTILIRTWFRYGDSKLPKDPEVVVVTGIEKLENALMAPHK